MTWLVFCVTNHPVSRSPFYNGTTTLIAPARRLICRPATVRNFSLWR